MTVYFDRNRQKWRYHFELNGKRRTGYCIDPKTKQEATSKREAITIQEVIRSALKQSPNEAPPPPTAAEWTLAEGFADWIEKVATQHRNWPTVKGRVAELLRYFGPATPLGDVTESLVWDYIAWARKQKVRIYLGSRKGTGKWRETDRLRSDSTINRYVAALSAMLNHAHRQRDPVTKQRRLQDVPDLPELDEPGDLPTSIRPEQARAILERAAPHLYDAIVLAAHTGLRLREIVRLERHQVDLQNRLVILDSRSKNKRGAVVYINEVAYQVLARLIDDATRARQTRLILYRGPWGKSPPRPVDSLRTAWQAAQKRAGLAEPYRFHDLRATFITELARMGGHFALVKQAARHGDVRTTLRYLEVIDADLRSAVDALSGWEGTQAKRRDLDEKAAHAESHTKRRTKGRKIG